MASTLQRPNTSERKRFNQISAMTSGHVVIISALSLVNMHAEFKKTGGVAAFDGLQLQALIVTMVCAVATYLFMSSSRAKGDDSGNVVLRSAFLVLMFEMILMQGQAVFSLTPDDNFDVLQCIVALVAGVASSILWRIGRKVTPLPLD